MRRRSFKSPEQIENLRLDGHIERRGRLVGHEQFRFGRQRQRDHHPLLHAAGHFVRIISQARFRRGNPHQFQQADDFRVRGSLGPVQLERFLDLPAHPKHGVEGRARFLKNITDDPASQLPQIAFGRLQHIDAVQQDFAAFVMGGRAGQQSRDGEGRHAFPGTAFPDQAKRFPGLKGKGHAIDDAGRLLARTEFELKIFNFQQLGKCTIQPAALTSLI